MEISRYNKTRNCKRNIVSVAEDFNHLNVIQLSDEEECTPCEEIHKELEKIIQMMIIREESIK